MKVYIAGPMTGIPQYNYPKFQENAENLRKKGYIVLSPAEIPNATEQTREWCMKRAIELLLQCDFIYLLDGWQESKGATLEKQIADQCGIKKFD